MYQFGISECLMIFFLTDETTDLAQLLLRLQMEKEAETQAAR